MKNMKVTMKLVVSFAIVIVLAIGMGGVGVYGLFSLNNATTEMYNSNIMAIEAMGELRAQFNAERNDLRNAIINQNNADTVNGVINSFANYDATAAANFEKYEATITDISIETDYFAAKEAYLGDYAEMKRNFFAAAKAGDFVEVDRVFVEGAFVIPIIQNGFNQGAALNSQWANEANLASDALFRNMVIAFGAILAITVIVSLFLAIYVSGLISKPLKIITAFMKKAGATGDVTLRPEDVANIGRLQEAKDELGELIVGCAGFVGHVTNISNNLDTIANGDLTVELQLLSENDVMGKALQQMVHKLNGMFGEIKTATNQVSTGSVQIADGAQLLAQGATEQSATVQELSASVTEVNGQTKANAGLANDAKKLGEDIRANAERGNAQMEQMIKAVGEISDASTAIGKVIKIIDDIAFQTNILALNAAVEAARAGQHGKGFAVVADEVRSLAAKSAEAAKNTSELIATSIEKSEQGAAISKETAESLGQIVGGIVQSSELVAKIAESSNAQSLSIGQIGEAIDQVSQVIQQNSATAEESAAASEEMSGQATMLQQLIAQFRLKAVMG
jgi:methyl-accepting chemotaxis protein